jgi:hypothetical protein
MNNLSPYQCKEWIETINGEEIGFDSHEWKELITTKELQILKCELCGKHRTSKFME